MTREFVINIMDITYLGHSSFRIKGKTAVVLTDPFDPSMVGLRYPKISSDIVSVSHNHADHNQIDLVSDVKKIVEGPGEYEILGVSIIGIASYHDDKGGEERGKNTIFVFEMEDLRLAHLGDLGHKLSRDKLEEIGEIDILMLPVGGIYTIGPHDASEVIREIDPSLIIPMHYKMEGMKEEAFGKLSTVDDFVKESGLTSEKMEKLSVKKSEIGEEQKVIVLERKV